MACTFDQLIRWSILRRPLSTDEVFLLLYPLDHIKKGLTYWWLSASLSRRANEKLANKLREQADTIRLLQGDKKTQADEIQTASNRIRQLEAANAELKTEQLKLKVKF